MKIEIDDVEDIIDEENNIYQKLARATARAVDINLGGTTLADLLDGYTKSRILQQRIDKAIEYIKENKYVSADENCEIIAGWRIDELLEILGEKEIKEIPQFKGTLEQLDNLTILGDKENEYI